LQRKALTRYWWHQLDADLSISFFDVQTLPVTLVYKGQPITGNVVEIYKRDQRFPITLNCPVEMVEP
jgi:hypothetical protein